jgi:Uma2 family endonuclease
MNVLVRERPYTPEDLLTIEGGRSYELVGGRLVEKNLGLEASAVVVNLLTLLRTHVKAHRLGHVLEGESGYQIFSEEPNRVRKPDGSFIAHGRLPDERLPRGHCRIPPDLVVEVVSPNDLAEEVNQKATEYLGADVRLLWVVYPGTKTVHVFRRGGGAAWLTAADELSGEDVVAGFSCRVAEVFADV